MAISTLSSKRIFALSAVSLVLFVAYFYMTPQENKDRATQQTEGTFTEVTQAAAPDPVLLINKEQALKTPQVVVANEKEYQKETLQRDADRQEEREDAQLLAEIDAEIAASNLQPVLWEPLRDDEVFPDIKISEKIEGAQKIKMNLDVLNDIVPGEQIHLPILSDNNYSIDVKEVFDDKKNINIRGHIEAHGSSYLVTITQGKKTTFATISTPDGTYDLRLVNGKGWVYGADQLNKFLDTTKPDTLLPPKDLISD